jgi:hypothetical protein
MLDAAREVGAGLVGLGLVFGVCVLGAFVIAPAWRRLREAWRDVNRPLR